MEKNLIKFLINQVKKQAKSSFFLPQELCLGKGSIRMDFQLENIIETMRMGKMRL